MGEVAKTHQAIQQDELFFYFFIFGKFNVNGVPLINLYVH
jgi:hypothetical protein